MLEKIPAEASKFHDDLSVEEIWRVEVFMPEYIHVRTIKDEERYLGLHHPTKDEEAITKIRETVGSMILKWEAHRFRLPLWGISERTIYEPAPTIWIKMTIKTKSFLGLELPVCFPIAPNAAGEMRICHHRGLTPPPGDESGVT